MRLNIYFAMSIALLFTCVFPAYAQDWAKTALSKSPRHLEWVTVKNNNREVKCFIAYPEVKHKATAVVVIHEIFGLADWVRSVTDQLAAAGYVAIAPDLLSDGKEGTAGYKDEDAVRKAVTSLPPDQITGDLKAVAAYIAKQPGVNGKVTTAGFCWGGSQAFRFANNNPDLKASFVFYGRGPAGKEEVTNIKAPVYGFYAENDARVNATIDATKDLMAKEKKTFEPVIYKGAGHGFMRAGEAPDASEANKTARADGWKRWLDLLKNI
jgi:carboxymethylenebutenolidase